jgi:hypothetical protein
MLHLPYKKILKNLFIIIAGSCAGLMTSSLSAQVAEMGEGLEPPSVRRAIDSFGVDAISGSPAGFGGMYVSIGTEDSGIKRDPGRQRFMHDNHTGTLTFGN